MRSVFIAASLTVSLGAEPVDLVKKGAEEFHMWACSECHVVKPDDVSIKSGPPLYGLFLRDERNREVIDVATGKPTTVKADRSYFYRSVRKPGAFMAIAEKGDTKGTAYQPVMPEYKEEMVKEESLEAIYHYLRTCCDEDQRGPSEVMGEWKGNATKVFYDNSSELLIGSKNKIQRAPVVGASGRAIHVGLVSGANFSFDPRYLSLRSVWGGGFLNLALEHTGRSKPGSVYGVGSQEMRDATPLLTPVNPAGNSVDFAFKEPDWNDEAAIVHHLEKGGDFLKELAAWDANFLGYAADATNLPTFAFRVGKNTIKQTIRCDAQGLLTVEIFGEFVADQAFVVAANAVKDAKFEGGTVADGKWTIPAGTKMAKMTLKLAAPALRQTHPLKENLAPQALVVTPQMATLPSGYAVENWQAPVDDFGRKILFEPTAIAVAKNGTIVLGTRTAGVWRLRDKTWSLFAPGTYECLGLVIEDDKGDVITIAQKPEITRLTDSDGDGRADQYVTICDDYGFHGNYHEYTHGLVKDEAGNYYFSLNLSHSSNEKASYKAGGAFMGSMGGYRGWSCRVTPAGVFEPYASGLRSPAGIGMNPENQIVYIENQGEYAGSSKIHFLKQGRFYGHPSGLVSLSGMKPGAKEVDYEQWRNKSEKAALWFPHNRYANSPGNPAWDRSGGKFGPFEGQMFVGDQTLSTLVRVGFEKIGDVDQGWMTMFGRNLASGVMRPCFLPDGSLLLGQTGRGWVSKGGNVASLQRISWVGNAKPTEIERVATEKDGFRMFFTVPLAANEIAPQMTLRSWYYTDESRYGSPEVDAKNHSLSAVTVAEDRMSVHVKVSEFADAAKSVDRLYWLALKDAKKWLGTEARAEIEAVITVRALPK
jgi:glucose/arabinose dehydrogenase